MLFFFVNTGYKLCKFYENCARGTPLRGVYIPHFDQISIKISVLGFLCPYRCTDGGEIWHFFPLLRAKFHPRRCNMSLLWDEKPQNRPLSNLNNRRFAQRAMLPVMLVSHYRLNMEWTTIKGTFRSRPYTRKGTPPFSIKLCL